MLQGKRRVAFTSSKSTGFFSIMMSAFIFTLTLLLTKIGPVLSGQVYVEEEDGGDNEVTDATTTLKGPSPEEAFYKIDWNQDGYVSGEEWDYYMEHKSAGALFVGLFDADDSGCLDALEFTLMMFANANALDKMLSWMEVPSNLAHAEYLLVWLWKTMSGDADGCIDTQELKNQEGGSIEILTTDLDKDGLISLEEFKVRHSSVSIYDGLSMVGPIQNLQMDEEISYLFANTLNMDDFVNGEEPSTDQKQELLLGIAQHLFKSRRSFRRALGETASRKLQWPHWEVDTGPVEVPTTWEDVQSVGSNVGNAIVDGCDALVEQYVGYSSCEAGVEDLSSQADAFTSSVGEEAEAAVTFIGDNAQDAADMVVDALPVDAIVETGEDVLQQVDEAVEEIEQARQQIVSVAAPVKEFLENPFDSIRNAGEEVFDSLVNCFVESLTGTITSPGVLFGAVKTVLACTSTAASAGTTAPLCGGAAVSLGTVAAAKYTANHVECEGEGDTRVTAVANIISAAGSILAADSPDKKADWWKIAAAKGGKVLARSEIAVNACSLAGVDDCQEALGKYEEKIELVRKLAAGEVEVTTEDVMEEIEKAVSKEIREKIGEEFAKAKEKIKSDLEANVQTLLRQTDRAFTGIDIHVQGFCGYGERGNGICEDGTCCSQHGWCGTSPAYCIGGLDDNGISVNTCGNGDRGDGVCSDGTCCSQNGWCGTSTAHCWSDDNDVEDIDAIEDGSFTGDMEEGSCGKGRVGDGVCSDGSCCSAYGWCGNYTAYCRAVRDEPHYGEPHHDDPHYDDPHHDHHHDFEHHSVVIGLAGFAVLAGIIFHVTKQRQVVTSDVFDYAAFENRKENLTAASGAHSDDGPCHIVE